MVILDYLRSVLNELNNVSSVVEFKDGGSRINILKVKFFKQIG